MRRIDERGRHCCGGRARTDLVTGELNRLARLCESYNALAVEERRRLGPITDRPGEAFTLRLRSRLARDCALATRTALWRVGAPELQAAALIYTRALIDARATLTDLARPGAPAPHRVAVSHVLTTAGLREAAAFWHALVEALGTPRMPPPPDPQTVRRRVELR